MSKVCLSLSGSNVQDLIATFEQNKAYLDIVEIRADSIESSQPEHLSPLIEILKKEFIPFIWTVRWKEEQGSFELSEVERLKWIQFGDQEGAHFIDIEAFSEISKTFHPKNAKLILSYHDFETTPQNCHEIVSKIDKMNPDVIKVAFMAHQSSHLRHTLELYQKKWSAPLIAISMSEWGEASRILPSKFGLPWSYGAPIGDSGTAPGQYNVRELSEDFRLPFVDKKTPLYAVIGDPVSHSLSPKIHNQHYKNKNIDALYGKIHIDHMDEFYKIADILELKGASVTVPHKESLMQHVSDNDWIKHVGAANTLIRKENSWNVENTDIAAALSAIDDSLQITHLPKVLLLGAGGVSRGLAWGMKQRNWKVTICNRNISRANQLADSIQADVLDWNDRDPHGFDIIINGTTLGMTPYEESTPLEFHGSHQGLVVFDTVYTPEKTKFLNLAQETGATIITGREMFYRQAALQHAHWFQSEAPFDEMKVILERNTN